MSHETGRRAFLTGALAASTAAVSLAGRSATAAEAEPGPGKAPAVDVVPNGRIGDLNISRMLLGGNLLTHYTHSRDLKYVYNLAAHYNTADKICETLALAEAHGVNTLSVHTVPATLATLKKYRYEMGGKMQWIICPTASVDDDLSAYAKQVRELVDDGCEAIYLWGVHADRLVAKGRVETVRKLVDIAKDNGVPSGVGGHDINVVKQCEEHGVDADFYIKTFHHHDYPTGPKPDEITGPYREIPGYWCSDPNEVTEVMKDVERPWIAFKVMAAGAIPPANAFQYAFDNGADHCLVGMFDFEIAEDARIMNKVLGRTKRTRPWRS